MEEHIQIRFGSDQEEKNYLSKEVKAYKSAKLEEIIETQMELINVADPTDTKPTKDNYKDQIEELKTVIMKVKDASKKNVGNLNERTKGLEKNKIWQALTNEENTIIVDKIDLSAARLTCKNRLKKQADTNYSTDSDKKIDRMTLKDLSENEYLEI